MNIDVQQLEFRRNNLYRDQYRRTLKWILMMSVIGVGLAMILAYLSFREDQPNYYATTSAGSVIPMHSLSEPIITNDFLLQWSSIAVRGAFNLDFLNYQKDLSQIQPNFTPGGWAKYLGSLKSSGLLESVQDKKLMMSGVVSGAPVILNKQLLQGRMTWRIQMPLLITFTSASQTTEKYTYVTIDIQRVPDLDAAEGVQISDFFTSQLSGDNVNQNGLAHE